MKLSEAMEKGLAIVGENQCRDCCAMYDGKTAFYVRLSDKPEACCAIGFACYGYEISHITNHHATQEVVDYVVRLNDRCKMPIREIIETLRGMGL